MSDAMTPERLYELRERAEWASLGPSASRELLAHVDHLTAENARLRAGISRLFANVERWHADLPRDRADSLIRSDLADLLNPDTEEP